jgi:hypothetical protein
VEQDDSFAISVLRFYEPRPEGNVVLSIDSDVRKARIQAREGSLCIGPCLSDQRPAVRMYRHVSQEKCYCTT